MILTPAEHAEIVRQHAENPDGPIYLTVEGDPATSLCSHALVNGMCPVGHYTAPSRFVEATGPCEAPNCENGKDWTRMFDGEPLDCPSCEGTGIKRAELRATCTMPLQTHDGPWHVDCCDGGGSVLFAHATIEVLPVITEERWGEDNPPLPCVVITFTGKAVHNGLRIADGWGNELHLDPLPVPGRDWVVKLDGLVLA